MIAPTCVAIIGTTHLLNDFDDNDKNDHHNNQSTEMCSSNQYNPAVVSIMLLIIDIIKLTCVAIFDKETTSAHTKAVIFGQIFESLILYCQVPD